MWGYPLWLFVGLWIVMVSHTVLDAARMTRIVAAWAVVFALFVVIFVANYSRAAVFRSPLPRRVLSRRQARRGVDAALPRRDRRAAALCHRLDVGRRQSRALFAGPAAGADRRRAGAARRGSISTICARMAPSWCGRRATPRQLPAQFASRRARRRGRRAVRRCRCAAASARSMSAGRS